MNPSETPRTLLGGGDLHSQGIVEGAMTEPTDVRAGDRSFDQFLGSNPFPTDDARHESFVLIARHAAEADARLKAKLLLMIQDGSPDDFSTIVLKRMVGLFDIWATSLVVTVSSYSSAERCRLAFGQLTDFMRSWLTSMKLPVWVDRVQLTNELLRQLAQRSAHWQAEALKAARETEEQPETSVETPGTTIESPKSSDKQSRAKARRTFVEPKLTTLNMSLLDWGKGAVPPVDYNTVRDYLDGTTLRLRINTRSRLATALQVSPDDLPE